MSIISGFNKVKNYVKTTEGYKLLSRWTSSDTVDVNGKTLTEVVSELGTASKKDVATSGNASTTQVVMGNDTRLSDSRKASDVYDWAKAKTKPTYTASEVGLGNVGNFKAVSTVASQGLTDTEKDNARTNIGAQVAGSYASASHTHDDRYYTESEIDTKLSGKANSSHTHGNADITAIDASKITSGTISIDRLPQGALERLTIVADDTARFKLTSATVQKGDTVKVTATGKMYYVVDETKLSSESGYEVYAAGTAASVPWSGVTDKPSTFTPSSHTHTKSQITDFPTSMPASDVSAWAKASTKPSYTKSEVGLGNVDNTADANKSVKYATSAGSATSASKTTSVIDYGNTEKTIQIGYSGAGATISNLSYIAGYLTGGNQIKDVSKDTLKSWLGLGSLAYSSATIPTIPSSLPANGGNSSTVNGHTVNSDVPANAKFTDTNTWTALKGATTSAAGTAGYAPAPSAGAANRYLRSDGTWSVPPDNNTTYSNMTAATSNAAGKAGLVPAPSAGAQGKYLRGDGTWQTPPDTNTTYSVATQSANGLLSASDKKKLDGIASGANAYSLPTASSSTLGGIKVGSNLSISNGVLSATNTWRGISDTYSSSTTSGSSTSLSQKGAYDMYTELNGNLNNFGGDGFVTNNKVSSEKLYGRRIDSVYTYYCKTWVTSVLSISQVVTYTDTNIQFKYIDLSRSRLIYGNGVGAAPIGIFGDQVWLYGQTVNYKAPPSFGASGNAWAEICFIYKK